MAQYIDKSALVAKIEDRCEKILFAIAEIPLTGSQRAEATHEREILLNVRKMINALEVKELAPTTYVVTRCEEHSDYVEKVFFDEDKAQEYCDQFKGDENEYARHITKVEVTL